MIRENRILFTALSMLTTSLFAALPARAADPTTADCLSANDNSISLRSQHKLRAARAELLICAAANCPADIRNECARRVTEVNTSMPTIVFDAKDASGNDLSAVRVTMDGQVLVERLEGTALSIDPGEHNFVFETANQQPVQRQFVIREGEKERRERIQFATGQMPPVAGAAPVAAAPAPGPAGPAMVGPAPQSGPIMPPPQQPPPATADTGKKGGSGKKTAGWILTVVGVGAGAAGIVEQVSALNKDKQSKDEAKSPTADPAKVHSLHSDAKSAQTIAIACGAVGVVAFAAGLYLVLSSG